MSALSAYNRDTWDSKSMFWWLMFLESWFNRSSSKLTELRFLMMEALSCDTKFIFSILLDISLALWFLSFSNYCFSTVVVISLSLVWPVSISCYFSMLVRRMFSSFWSSRSSCILWFWMSVVSLVLTTTSVFPLLLWCLLSWSSMSSRSLWILSSSWDTWFNRLCKDSLSEVMV